MESKVKHLMYVPFTGLGLYGGFRGKRWLRNRVKIFCQFVVPSLLSQSSQNFIIWVSWRHEDRNLEEVQSLKTYLETLFGRERVVFTYSGVCFWDDKHPDDVARLRLINAIHGSTGALLNILGECDEVLMTIQPSDDCYSLRSVEQIQKYFHELPDIQALGFKQGYVMDYTTLTVAEWNPNTTPPFFTIRFKKDVFSNPLSHVEYTGPYKSHEYIGDKLKLGLFEERGFLVGTHGENISTVFTHPFRGKILEGQEKEETLKAFGLNQTPPLKLKISLRKALMRKLPHGWQRKLRYWFGERMYAKIYEFIRS